jgi:uncharacterized protein (TIGR03435 family)
MVLKRGPFFVAIVIATLGVAAIRTAAPLGSQSASPAPAAGNPAFEVASVKIAAAGNFAISPYGQGRFSIRSASLTLLVSLAYNVSDAQISGGPSWRDSEYYDVTAKAEDGVMLTYEELRPRLQELLAQRFKLAIHREVRQSPGYALVVAKGGPKLPITNREASTLGSILPGGLRAPGISMDSFASMLASPVGRPVVNETGLSGNYEIAIDYAPEAVADSSLPSIFTALQERLGLKLDARTVPVEMIVIDHVEHPTEN